MAIENAKSVGEVQRKLEAAQEHLNAMWGRLARENLLPEPLDDKPKHYPRQLRRWPFESLAYPLAAINMYVDTCVSGMREFVGSIEGQLCPHDDCHHDLAIEMSGWCRCGHCKRAFYADDSDGDFEDYHVRKPKAGEVVPEALLFCRDLGPSWATPD